MMSLIKYLTSWNPFSKSQDEPKLQKSEEVRPTIDTGTMRSTLPTVSESPVSSPKSPRTTRFFSPELKDTTPADPYNPGAIIPYNPDPLTPFKL